MRRRRRVRVHPRVRSRRASRPPASRRASSRRSPSSAPARSRRRAAISPSRSSSSCSRSACSRARRSARRGTRRPTSSSRRSLRCRSAAGAGSAAGSRSRAAASAVDLAGCRLLHMGGAASAGVADLSLPRMLEAGANCLPVAILFLGIAALAYALVPRASAGIAYGLAIVAFLWQLFGSLLGAPQVARRRDAVRARRPDPRRSRSGLVAAIVMLAIGCIAAVGAVARVRAAGPARAPRQPCDGLTGRWQPGQAVSSALGHAADSARVCARARSMRVGADESRRPRGVADAVQQRRDPRRRSGDRRGRSARSQASRPSHSPSPMRITGKWRIVAVWISVSASNSSSSVPNPPGPITNALA